MNYELWLLGVTGFQYAIACMIMRNCDGRRISVIVIIQVHYIEPPAYNTGLYPQPIIHRQIRPRGLFLLTEILYEKNMDKWLQP